jgi:hypothetical protein
MSRKYTHTIPTVVLARYWILTGLAALVVHSFIGSVSLESSKADTATVRAPAQRNIPRPSSLCVITVTAWSNHGLLDQWRDTLLTTNPDISCIVWFVADNPIPWNPVHNTAVQNIRAMMEPKMHLVTADELLVQIASSVSLHQQAFLYDSHEFAAALKPLAFQYAFHALSAQSVLYLECDYWIRDTLPAAIASLARANDYAVVVLPNWNVQRGQEGWSQLVTEWQRFGCVALKHTPSTMAFLQWQTQELSQTYPSTYKGDLWSRMTAFFNASDILELDPAMFCSMDKCAYDRVRLLGSWPEKSNGPYTNGTTNNHSPSVALFFRTGAARES